MGVKYRKDIYVLFLAIILIFIWAGYMENSKIASLFWIGLLMALLPIITIARAWFGINVQRVLPKDRIYAGDKLRVIFWIENRIYIPFLWVRFEDKIPYRYLIKNPEQEDVSESLYLLKKGRQTFTYALEDVPRGVLKWSSIKLFRSDLLGLVEVTKSIDNSQDALVYPKFIDISPNELYNQNDENHGVTRLFKGNDYSQISGVREYQRGDKLSLIHWKVSARKNNLMSKEFYPLLNQETHIVLDCDKNNYPGDYNEQFELGVSIAASIVNSLAKVERGLNLVLNSKNKEIVSYKSKEYFLSDAMKKLALVNPDGESSIDLLLSQQYFNQNRGVTLFIITNKITDKTLNKLLLASKRVKPTVFLVGEKGKTKEKKHNYYFVRNIGSLEELLNLGARGVVNG